MQLTTQNLNNVYQTADQMRRLVETYFTDLGPWLCVPFIYFYRFVCNLPYIADPKNVEFVSRPALTANPAFKIARDCDDKAVLLASWCQGHDRKKRFVASSTKPTGRLHHVFLQLDTGLFCDATYPKNTDYLGEYPYFKKVTRIVPLTEFF
ncbi:MAG: hypothetical protein IKS59_03805 [Aeriscardovia sp.]|nr:hypothetical protein [Aeriscardovia sp.]